MQSFGSEKLYARIYRVVKTHAACRARTAGGVARPSAQGQATTTTETPKSREKRNGEGSSSRDAGTAPSGVSISGNSLQSTYRCVSSDTGYDDGDFPNVARKRVKVEADPDHVSRRTHSTRACSRTKVYVTHSHTPNQSSLYTGGGRGAPSRTRSRRTTRRTWPSPPRPIWVRFFKSDLEKALGNSSSNDEAQVTWLFISSTRLRYVYHEREREREREPRTLSLRRNSKLHRDSLKCQCCAVPLDDRGREARPVVLNVLEKAKVSRESRVFIQVSLRFGKRRIETRSEARPPIDLFSVFLLLLFYESGANSQKARFSNAQEKVSRVSVHFL